MKSLSIRSRIRIERIIEILFIVVFMFGACSFLRYGVYAADSSTEVAGELYEFADKGSEYEISESC